MTLRPMIPLLALLGLWLAVVGTGGWAARRRPPGRGQSRRWAVRALACTLLLAALARPSINGGSAPVAVENLDVFLVIDRSGSMNAEDFGAHRPRIEGVRTQLEKLAAESSGARFSVIGFSDKGFAMLPLTDNTEALVNALESFTVEDTSSSRGSSIDAGRAELAKALKRERDRYGHERRRIVVYAGDGEQNSGRPVQSFAALKSLVDAGLVLGYGTGEGGPMRVTDSLLGAETARYYIDAPDGKRAVSKIDEGNLKRTADQLGTSYRHMTADTDIKRLTATMRAGAVQKGGSNTAGHGETYWVLMAAAALLIAVELGLLARQQRTTRGRRAHATA